MKASHVKVAYEVSLAKSLCGDLSKSALQRLEVLVRRHKLSVADGDLNYLNSGCYVTHAGLLRLSERRHCAGIHVRPVLKSCDGAKSRWVFRATVFKSQICKLSHQKQDTNNQKLACCVSLSVTWVLESSQTNFL